MRNRRVKFSVAIAILFSAVAWLGVSGLDETQTYYKTADEFVRLDDADKLRRTRLMGNVPERDGAIENIDGELRFDVELNGVTVPVTYRGTAPIPDTFKPGAQVLVEGSLGSDGRFIGSKIQAKCASKYEADPAAAYATQPDAA